MKALIVIDMQDDYVGQTRNQKRYPYNTDLLVANINSRIVHYSKNGDIIIYIKNKGKHSVSPFTSELQIASDLVFEKDKANCFSNEPVLKCLNRYSVKEIELVGVDGNSCVGMSANAGAKLGFHISISQPITGNRILLAFLVSSYKFSCKWLKIISIIFFIYFF